METVKKRRRIFAKMLLISLIAISVVVLSTIVETSSNSSKSFLFWFYLTGAVFFSLFLIQSIVSSMSKNKATPSLNIEKKINPNRNQHHYYRRVIKKTA